MTCHAGKVLGLHRELRCHSKQGQRAAAQQRGPDISQLDPHLQQQWDHSANAHLGNIDIKPHSSRKVRWMCDQCPDSHIHSWSAQVSNRTNGRGCPQCRGRKVCKHNSLATKDPSVAAQWDYEENDGTPDSVTAQSNQPAAWHCDACGHKWSVQISSRVNPKKRNGCPRCAGEKASEKAKMRIKHPTFAESKHPLLAEWDHARNAFCAHFPEKIRLRSQKQIFWLCNKCPAGQQHSWPATPAHRTGRHETGCPFCVGRAACQCNSLQALFPSIAAEWDYGKNKYQPSDYPASSSSLAWWVSPQRGSWQQTITRRTSNIQQKAVTSKRAQQRLSPPSD